MLSRSVLLSMLVAAACGGQPSSNSNGNPAGNTAGTRGSPATQTDAGSDAQLVGPGSDAGVDAAAPIMCERDSEDANGKCVDIDECATNNGGCGNATYWICTNEAGAAPVCTDINECATDNGGCGNAAFWMCTNNEGAPPVCTDINECATDNGGCGNAAFWMCTNNEGAPPACADIDECATNNGGCGNATYFSCTNSPGGHVCADIDECGTNNGGCGNATYWICTNEAGAAPVCTDINECATDNGGCGNAAYYACKNYLGSYSCADINECVTGNGGCDTSPKATCNNVVGAPNTCTCPSGYSGTGVGINGCTDVDECSTGNGGCDALTTCMNTVGSRSCGACPADYIGTGATGCAPTLTGLTLSSGTLSPALSSAVQNYAVDVALATQTLTLTPTVPSGATITINGQAVASGADWQSPVLPFVRFPILIVVSQVGHPSRNYSVTVTRGYQEAYLKASDPYHGSDHFGYSVAASGDTVVVGAYGEEGAVFGNPLAGAGAAYVFVRNGNAWSQQAYLTASNAGGSDHFGRSVSISGDTLVIGAFGESGNATGVNGNQSDDSASYSGAAYVFVRSGTTWSQQAYLKASNTAALDQFACSVSISGDTVVVGAFGESSNATGVNGNQSDNSASYSGAAYVFVRSGTTWSQQAYLKASNTQASDSFGYSVAVSADTLVVGAAGESSNATGVNGNEADNSTSGSGAAYVFVRSGTTWTQQAYLKASNTQASDAFGEGVSISGDTLVVGAYLEDSNATGVNGNQADNGATDSGAGYVFTRSGSVWSQQAYLKASTTGAGDRFGRNVSISGDTLIVGASAEDSDATGVDLNSNDNRAPDSGVAYVFGRNGGTWIQQAYLKASNTEAGDTFGYGVAVSSDTLVVGAPYEDSPATVVNGSQSGSDGGGGDGRGAAYVFR